MRRKEDVLGELVKVEKQPLIYDGKLLCPVCEEEVEGEDWEMINGEMQVWCRCEKCRLLFDVWFSLHYLEHSSIDDLDEF